MTLCRLQKRVWRDVKLLKKPELLRALFSLCLDELSGINIETYEDFERYFTRTKASNGAIHVCVRGMTRSRLCVQPDIEQYMKITKIADDPDDNETGDSSDEVNILLQHLPDDVIRSLGEESLALIRSVVVIMVDRAETHEDDNDTLHKGDVNMAPDRVTNEDRSSLLEYLAEQIPNKFQHMTMDKLNDLLMDATSMNKNFTVPELIAKVAKLNLKMSVVKHIT